MNLIQQSKFKISICKYREEHDEEIYHDFEYIKISNEFDEVFAKISKFIPDDEKDLLFRIDELFSERMDFDGERSYFYGFKDGANLIMDILNQK